MQITLPFLLAALVASTSAVAIPQPISVDGAPHVENPKSNFKIPIGDITHYSKDGLDGPEVRAVKEDEENPKEHNLSQDLLDSDDGKDASHGAKKHASDNGKKTSSSSPDDAKKHTSAGDGKMSSDDKWSISASFGQEKNEDSKSSETSPTSDSKKPSDDKSWSIDNVFGKSDSKSHDSKPSSSSTFASSSDSKKSSGGKPWTESISDWFKSDSKDSKSSFKSKSINARGDGKNVKNSEPLTDAKKFVDEKVKDLKDWIDKNEKQGH